MQGKDLGDVDPGNAVDRCTEDKHVLRQISSISLRRLRFSHKGKFEDILTVKKKATLADAVGRSTSEPLKLSKIDIIIIEMPSPKDPQIIGFRRPMRSARKVGTKDPTKNIIWILVFESLVCTL